MSVYTHWACFDCRKSFHYSPADNESSFERKCPECREKMVDMGIYFDPPRRNATKAWAIMRLLADNGFRFRSEGEKAYAEAFIFGRQQRPAAAGGRPNIREVKRIIQDRKLNAEVREVRRTTKWHKEIKTHQRKFRKLMKVLPTSTE